MTVSVSVSRSSIGRFGDMTSANVTWSAADYGTCRMSTGITLSHITRHLTPSCHHLKRLYLIRHNGRKPAKTIRIIRGWEREVYGYAEADRDLIDQAIAQAADKIKHLVELHERRTRS